MPEAASCIQFVVDDYNYPLMAMERTEIVRQGLKHRNALLTVYDTRQHMFLRQRPSSDPIYPGRWDVMGSGPVPVDLSGEDLARSWLPPFEPFPEITHAQTINASIRTGHAFIEVFTTRLQAADHVFTHDHTYLTVDQDELEALTTAHPELFTPLLMVLQTQGLAFASS